MGDGCFARAAARLITVAIIVSGAAGAPACDESREDPLEPAPRICAEAEGCGASALPDATGRGSITGAAMSGNHLFALGAGGLEIYDTSNPAAPALAAPAGERWLDEEAYVEIVVDAGFVYYFARFHTTPTDNSNYRLHIVDVRDPRRPHWVSSFDATLGRSASGLGVAGGIVTFWAPVTNDGVSLLHVVDARDPASPRLVATTRTELEMRVDSSVRIGDMVYATGWAAVSPSEVSFRLVSIDMSEVASPTPMGSLLLGPVGGRVVPVVMATAIDERTLLVSAGTRSSARLYRVTVADPSAPTIVAEGPGRSADFVDLVSVGDRSYGLTEWSAMVIDHTAPVPVVLGGAFFDGAAVFGLRIDGAVVQRISDTQVHSVDLSDPASPIALPPAPLDRRPTDATSSVAISGSHAYVADGSGGLGVYSLCPSGPPLRVASLFEGQDITEVQAAGDYVAILNATSETLHLVHVGTPTEPRVLGVVPSPGLGVFGSRFALTDDALFVAAEGAVDIYAPDGDLAAGSLGRAAIPGGDGVGTLSAFGSMAYALTFISGGSAIVEVDATDPAAPEVRGPYPLDEPAGSLAAADGVLAIRLTDRLVFVDTSRLSELPEASSDSATIAEGGRGVAVTRRDGDIRAVTTSDELITLWSVTETGAHRVMDAPLSAQARHGGVALGDDVALVAAGPVILDAVELACGPSP